MSAYRRKKELQEIIFKQASRVLYAEHIEERGEDLFKLTTDRDLEGIVGKWKRGAYRGGEKTSWVKIRNSHYVAVIISPMAHENLCTSETFPR